MKSVVVALVGEIGAGKETCKDILWDLLHERGMNPSKKVLRFSDILFETLSNWSVVTSRPNLQKLSQVMDRAYGKGTLTRAVHRRIEDDQHQFKVVDGVRWLTDAAMVRTLVRSALIYVTADQKIRYERAKARRTNAKAGEADVTWEEFCKLDKAKNERYISQIGAQADYRIINNGNLDEYRTQVRDCFEKIILPLMHPKETEE